MVHMHHAHSIRFSIDSVNAITSINLSMKDHVKANALVNYSWASINRENSFLEMAPNSTRLYEEPWT